MAIPPPPDGFHPKELQHLDKEGVLVVGILLFNQQHYWYAHEVWESKWIDLPKTERHFFQALIQFAAAMHHAQNENEYGFETLIGRSLSSLSKASASHDFIETELISSIILNRREDGCPAPITLRESEGPQLPIPQGYDMKKISQTLSSQLEKS